jgi:O-antigen ligase
VFLIWEFARYLILHKGIIRIGSTAGWSILLALWWIVPIAWLDRAHTQLFIKEFVTICSQVLILILFYTTIRNRSEWEKLHQCLNIIAVYAAVSGLIYTTGIWREKIPSLVGLLLPSELTNSSEFFSSITIRSLGMVSNDVLFFSHRASGFALQPGGLSMICLLLIPFVIWQAYRAKGEWRIGFFILLIGLFLGLVQTESRISYLAIIIGLTTFLFFRYKSVILSNKILIIPVTMLFLMIFTGIVYYSMEEIVNYINLLFVESRAGSFATRLTIYKQTLTLLSQHLIAGWGQPVEIEGLRSVFSAGTHSSYLGMLFQHGIVGLFLYLGMWYSIWRKIIGGLNKDVNSAYRFFWIASAASMLSFMVRKLVIGGGIKQ